jgi:hypothetical protein
MDPLSISSSIAGLIMITNTIVTNGFKYLSEFKESGETVKSLFHEVNLLFGTLHSLQNVAARLEHQQSSIPPTTRIHHINACYVTLRKVEAQLEKVAAKRNTATDRTRQRVLWPLSKVETKNLLLEVERQKTSLSLALSADELYVDFLPIFPFRIAIAHIISIPQINPSKRSCLARHHSERNNQDHRGASVTPHGKRCE